MKFNRANFLSSCSNLELPVCALVVTTAGGCAQDSGWSGSNVCAIQEGGSKAAQVHLNSHSGCAQLKGALCAEVKQSSCFIMKLY